MLPALLATAEVLALMSAFAAWRTRDARWPFFFGVNAILPATLIMSAASPPTWRAGAALCAVLVYLARMNWVLLAWYGATGASKLQHEIGLAELIAITVFVANCFTLLYPLPFVWAFHKKGGVDAFDVAAFVLYVAGSYVHYRADAEKYAFKQDPQNRGKLLRTGPWGLSRHPNYFGDFLIYVSFAVFGASYAGLVAPIANLFQYYVDAIPKGEKMAQKKYGDQWVEYKAKTKCFMPYVF